MYSGSDLSSVKRRHLLGAVGASTVLVAMPGSSLFGFPESAGFSAAEKSMLRAIADTIIPDTDTIGAAKAGVADFIEQIVLEWMDPEQQTTFRAGMAIFDQKVRAEASAPFDRLPAVRREALLKPALIEAQATQKAADHKGHAPFLVWMKRLTVHGYYTSEAGASQELVLNVTPGEYLGCQKMAAGDRSFSMDRRHIPFINDNEIVRIK